MTSLRPRTGSGKSGGVFGKENFRKIRQLRNTYPGKRICVDGGVNAEVSFILRNMGVDTIVSGSYLVNNDSLGVALLKMRTENIHSYFLVKEFMIDLDDLPVLEYGNATIKSVLRIIEDYNLGFTFYLDQNSKFLLFGYFDFPIIEEGYIGNPFEIFKIIVPFSFTGKIN